MLLNLLREFETPLWTLIGVSVGFALSWFYSIFSRRREYRRRVTQAIERIKGGMYFEGARLGPQRISDLLPQFGEQEQIQILGEVGMESSLNANTDQVTQYILDEYRWFCTLYELSPRHHLIKRSRQDARRVGSIQSWLAVIGSNIVEFRQSEPLLRKLFEVGEILDTYAIAQRYPKVVSGQIRMYRDIGKLSVGIMSGVTGYKVLNFRYGVQEDLKRIGDVREQVQRSTLSRKVKSKLLAECEAAVGIIRNEQARGDT